MSMTLGALIKLAADVDRPRGRGWRCTCEFEDVVSEDGERLVGVEIAPVAGEQVLPRQETEVTLRLWAPLSRMPGRNNRLRRYRLSENVMRRKARACRAG
jgi:hypothetical protein